MPTPPQPQPPGRGYAGAPVIKAPDWHGWVVADTLLNGLSTGLFLAAGVADLALPEVFGPVARAAYPVALVLLLADLLCLVIDLGDPLRFHHMLRVFKPSSPMSFGVWSLTALSLPATAAAALSLFGDGSPLLEWLHRGAVILGLPLTLSSALYKGVLFSTSAQPGWCEARWLGGYLTSSALALGCAELLALAVLLGQDQAAARLRPALALLLVANLVPLGLLFREIGPAVRRMLGRGRFAGTVALTLGGGVVVPILLLLFTGWAGFTLAAVVLVVLGNLDMRVLIVRLPHQATPTG
jgi:hypothetical protein